MKLIVAEGLASTIEAMDDWWRTHRPAAPQLFTEELAFAFDSITRNPRGCPIYCESVGGTVRRVQMPKTRNHVYYVYREEEALILVISVWGGPRGSGPDIEGQ